MEKVSSEKDLGVVLDTNLSFSGHLAEKINKANKIVGLIRRTFVALDESIFKSLFIAIVRPILEYANQVWSPYLIKDIDAVENVQGRATRLIPSLKHLRYEERLKTLVVDRWNSLPDYVINEEIVIKFENNLDKAWSEQDIKFDHKACFLYNKIVYNLTSSPDPTTTDAIQSINPAENPELDSQA